MRLGLGFCLGWISSSAFSRPATTLAVSPSTISQSLGTFSFYLTWSHRLLFIFFITKRRFTLFVLNVDSASSCFLSPTSCWLLRKLRNFMFCVDSVMGNKKLHAAQMS